MAPESLKALLAGESIYLELNHMKIRSLCLIIILLSFFGCVESQNYTMLESRVAAIEKENALLKPSLVQNDLKTIKNRIKDGQMISKEEYAQLKYDIQVLKQELQKLQGAVQEVNYQFDEFSRNKMQEMEIQLGRLDNAISKNYEKVINIENHMGFEPTSGALAEDASDLPQADSVDTEQGAYKAAKAAFDNQDMENARIQFENFITKYPDSKNADNARFWIADSYYVEKRFDIAILEYQKMLEKYPDSNKLAAAKLKQGYAFAELGENGNARIILKELIKKFPGSQEAEYAAQKLKSLK